MIEVGFSIAHLATPMRIRPSMKSKVKLPKAGPTLERHLVTGDPRQGHQT